MAHDYKFSQNIIVSHDVLSIIVSQNNYCKYSSDVVFLYCQSHDYYCCEGIMTKQLLSQMHHQSVPACP
jgi:hypothetical protein